MPRSGFEPYWPAGNGQWVIPRKRGWKLACCDCGLVHTVDFTTTKHGAISARFRRDERATKELRDHRTREKLILAMKKEGIDERSDGD